MIVEIKELIHLSVTLWLLPYQCDLFFLWDCYCPYSLLTVKWRDDWHHSGRVTLEVVFHMKVVRAEWLLSIVTLSRFVVTWSCFSHTSEEILSHGLSLHQLFFFFSHIICFSLRTHCSASGRPTSLLAGLAGYCRQTCQATGWFCLPSWFKQRGILTGPCLLGEVGYDECWLPCELPDSVTQNVWSPTLLGNQISCPVIPCNTSISFFVHLCLRRWTAATWTAAKVKSAAAEV